MESHPGKLDLVSSQVSTRDGGQTGRSHRTRLSQASRRESETARARAGAKGQGGRQPQSGHQAPGECQPAACGVSAASEAEPRFR